MSKTIDSRPTPWRTVILVCGKCSRKLDGGFGPTGETTLRSALKDALKDQGYRRSVRVLETKCFGLCPKRAVVTLNATEPGRLLSISRGTDPETALGAILDEGQRVA